MNESEADYFQNYLEETDEPVVVLYKVLASWPRDRSSAACWRQCRSIRQLHGQNRHVVLRAVFDAPLLDRMQQRRHTFIQRVGF